MDNSFLGSFVLIAVLAGIALAVAWCLVPLILLGTNRRLSRLIELQTQTNAALADLRADQQKAQRNPP